MSELERRVQAARSALVVDVDAADTEAALSRFDDRLRMRRRVRAAAVGTTVVAAVVIAVLALDRPSATPSRAPEIAEAPAPVRIAPEPEVEDRVVYFSDGSRAELLEPRTELRMEAFSEDLLELALAAGEARFDVTPSSRRLFRVRTTNLRIEVLGTAFTVANDRDGAEEHVRVHEGRVAVYLDGNRHELSAKMSLSWDGERAVIEHEADETAELAEDPAPKKKRKKRRRRARRRRLRRKARAAVDVTPAIEVKKRWEELAQDGRFDAAYEELTETKESPKRTDSRALMLAADVARLSGHPREAVEYLEVVVRDHRSHPRALLASFTLGRILMRELDDPRRAADAFRTARELGPRGSLAEDALAHEAECRANAGQKARAASLAREYLEKYPDGRKSTAMRRLNGEP